MSEQLFDLSTLDGNNGFSIAGTSDDNLGYSVSSAGDINGDGIDDVVIGSPLSDPNGNGNSGKTYVVFGSKDGFNSTIDLNTLDGTKGFVINGALESDQSGRSVSKLGDINGDGVDDLAIGAPGSIGVNSGAAYVVFGSKDGNYFNSPLELSNLGNKGLTIEGSEFFNNNAGWSISSAGDFNGDGAKDLLIGATNPGDNGDGIIGESYVIFGKKDGFGSTSTLNIDDIELNDGLIIISSSDSNDISSNELNNLGYSVSSAGDINGDGVDDLILGAPYADPNGNNSGSSFVIYGRKSDNPFSDLIINVSQLNSNDGFTINGQAGEKSGFSVSKAGDINGDGIGDLIIGANDGNPDDKEFAGRSYVVFGKNGGFGDTLELADLNGSNGFAINGIKAFDNSGWSVSGLGDINGDGIDDLIIGANNGGTNSAGQAYVIYGSEAGFSPTFDLSSVNGDNGFIIDGLDQGGNLGNSVSSAGDVNDDGVNDLIVGAPFVNSGAGAAYVVFGKFVNQAPTDLNISKNSIDENVDEANSVVGSFSSVDPNTKDSFTYSFISGEGDADNNAFTINGNELKINASPDYEAKPEYTIRVRTTDKGGLSYDKQLTININNLDETAGNQAPTGLELTNNSIDENVGSEFVVGSLKTTDPDQNDTFTYTFVSGENDDDNNAFIIDGDQLKIKDSPDYEAKSNYKIRVKTQDAAGLTYEKALTVNINDVNENQSSGNNNTALLTKVSDDVFNIKGNDGKATLEVILTGRSSNLVNQLGVFTVDDAGGKIDGIDPGAAGYAEKALAKSQVIFSAIANSPAGFNSIGLDRLLGFNSNDNLRFYLVKGDSTVLFPAASTLKITDLGSDSFSLAWEDGSGNPTGFEDLLVTIKATDKAIPVGTTLQNKVQGESLDLRGISGAVKADFTVYREANFNNYIGFYQVTDANGGIDTNGDGTADVLPGQAGYVEAALKGRVSDINLTVNNGGQASFNSTLQGGSIYVPFLIADGRPDGLLDSNPNNNPNIYFSFLGANSDGVNHIRVLGDNTFGFEDLNGGGDKDYNDMIVKVNLTPVM